MIELLDDYDWQEVFALAGEQLTPHADGDGGRRYYSNAPSINPLGDVPAVPFAREDVVVIDWISLGQNDERDWLIGGRLSDGRYFFIAAGCDYTGWDCQSGGNAYVAADPATIERFAMGDDERERLSVVLPEDTKKRRTDRSGW